jgi:hypothetical protein
MAQTVFEQMGGSYVRQGNYELPVVALPPQEEAHIGVWGQRYRRWLKENHRVLYYNLLTSGRLDEQAAEVNARAKAMLLRLVQEMAEREGITEALKADDPMAWVRRMNNIHQRATEIVLKDILAI